MNSEAKKVYESIRYFIDELVPDLTREDYRDVLENLQTDIVKWIKNFNEEISKIKD